MERKRMRKRKMELDREMKWVGDERMKRTDEEEEKKNEEWRKSARSDQAD